MNQNKSCFKMMRMLPVLMSLLLPLSIASASTYKVLYRFTGGSDGGAPNAVIFDNQGNLYGTTSTGGAMGMGTVFELERGSDGSWKEIVLHSFGGPDGADPSAALVFDSNGILYGTTAQGGGCLALPNGCGVVFKLKPNSDGTWTERVIYRFKGYISDGATPLGNLIFDKTGNLYGTTSYGGPGGAGDVFQLKFANGAWTENILYMFTGNGPDGYLPFAGVVFDAAGNLYGTTNQGGNMNCPALYGCGVAFKLVRQADGKWTERVLHDFCSVTNCQDGRFPQSNLILDKNGNLYGTAAGGTARFGDNTVFKLQRNSEGKWVEQVIHRFSGPDGANPLAGLVFNATIGAYYGTTSAGGAHNGGTVFKMTPGTSTSWEYSVIHSFAGWTGYIPTAGVILDASGNLYGTASSCGPSAGCQGVVYEIIP
jgi:uncharacterized repeat protein (TIGR03803 family)